MDPFLRAAIDEAKQGLKEGGLPIGRTVATKKPRVTRASSCAIQGRPTTSRWLSTL